MGTGDAMREEIRIEALGPAISHYTDAVRFGDLLFISGVVAWDQEGNVVGKGDVVAQTEKIFDSMGQILARAGCGFADVLTVTVFLMDIEDRVKINPVRERVFGDTRPASTLIEVSKLVYPDLMIEINAVAGMPGD